jgi:hypothetical protein
VKRNAALWIVQGLLALLFIFAGGAKLVIPVEQMQQGGVALPGWFLHFIAVCEILGALGLVLPGIFKIKVGLTPVAAALLEVIMAGAFAITWYGQGFLPALVPLVTGIALAFVFFGRR